MTKKVEPHVPKRILHIGKYFPPHRGGMETVLRDQMNMQTRDEGLQVAAVVHSSERRLTDKVELQPLGYRVRHAARWFTAVFAPIAPFFAWSVYREIKKLDPDEIRVHMPNVSAFWLLLLPAARKRAWIVLWHSDVLPSKHHLGLRIFYRLYRPFEFLILRYAITVIASSPPYLNTSAALKSFREKCVVEPLQLDTERYPEFAVQLNEQLTQSGEDLLLLCVGRLTYYKDFGTVIRAIEKLPRARLRIVGEGNQKAAWVSLADQLGVSNRVSFLDDLSDEELWSEYQRCDLFCLPSIERTEAFGLVILEAALFGKPVIVADTEGSGMSWVAERIASPSATFQAGNAADIARVITAIQSSVLSST